MNVFYTTRPVTKYFVFVKTEIIKTSLSCPGGAEATCQNLDRDACPIFFSLKLNQILLF